MTLLHTSSKVVTFQSVTWFQSLFHRPIVRPGFVACRFLSLKMSQKKTYNFNAGPAKVPQEVLKEAQRDMLDYSGLGLGVMEMSHRSADFEAILKRSDNLLRELINIPQNYRVLFMHGGATGQFAGVPLNLAKLKGGNAVLDYVVTGSWSAKAAKEAEKYCQVNRVLPKTSVYRQIPDASQWKLDPNATYLYYTDNETIHGVEFPNLPPTLPDVPVICDMTSNFLTRPIDVTKYGVIVASTQKNAGIAGLAIVIVRDDLIGHAMDICPSILDWKVMRDNNSLYNTPPCYSIYMTELFLKWIKNNGGVVEMAARCQKKSQLIYDLIDGSGGFYFSPVAKDSRSRVVIPFRIGGPDGDDGLEKKFLEEAKKAGMIGLKGHRSVGGIRASMYDAVDVEEAEYLKNFMVKFAKENKK